MEDTGLTRLRAVLYTARVSLFAVLCQPSERMDDDTTHLQGAAHVHPPIIGALLLLAGCVVLRRMLAVPITAGIRRSTARPARNSSQQKPAAASPAAEGAPHAPAPRRLQEGGHGRQHGRRLEGALYHHPSALIVMAQQASVAVQHTQPGTAASRSQRQRHQQLTAPHTQQHRADYRRVDMDGNMGGGLKVRCIIIHTL